MPQSGTLLDEGGPTDSRSIRLASKTNTWIRNVRQPERAMASMLAAERIWKAKFPNISTRSLSATYNCFGLIFASRRTGILDSDEVVKIFEVEQYRVIPRTNVQLGDIIVYRSGPLAEIRHVGIVLGTVVDANANVSFRILSQWGLDGEYLHMEYEVPDVFGKSYEFRSERRLR